VAGPNVSDERRATLLWYRVARSKGITESRRSATLPPRKQQTRAHSSAVQILLGLPGPPLRTLHATIEIEGTCT